MPCSPPEPSASALLRALHRRDRILSSVGFAAEAFFATTQPERSMARVLARLGEASEVSRVYVFENSIGPQGQTLTSQRFEWVAEGVQPEIDNPELQGLDFEAIGLGRWSNVLGTRQTLHGNVASFPPMEREFLEAQNITSIAVVPIFVGGAWWGCIGFDHCEGARAWSEAELDALRVAANTLGAALARAAADAALRASEVRYRTLLDAASDPVFVIDVHEQRVTLANERAGALTGYEAGTLAGLHVADLLAPSEREKAERLLRYAITRWHGSDAVYETAFSLLCKDGQFKPVAAHARLVHMDGLPVVQASVRDITAQIEHERALVQAKERAEEMARLKDAFLRNMSHEIRTPLTSVLGFSRLLAAETCGEQARLVEYIVQGGERLLDTLNSVLDLAQLDSGNYRLQRSHVDLVELIRRIAASLAPQAAQKGIHLRVELPRRPLRAWADRTALDRVVTNLAANAIKFTDGGTVTMGADLGGGSARLWVSDTGVGMEQEFLKHLFDEFRQESMGQSRSHEGNGLGLSITKKLVDLLGGEINVESQKGVGSRFTVRLPSLERSPQGLEPRPQPAGVSATMHGSA